MEDTLVKLLAIMNSYIVLAVVGFYCSILHDRLWVVSLDIFNKITLSLRLIVGVMFLGVLLTGSGHSQGPIWTEENRREWLATNATVEKKLMVSMRDGVRLATDVFRPKNKSGRLPVIFWRTPYNINNPSGRMLTFAHESIARGFAFVLQSERGRYFSEGEWEILGLPRTDGVDAFNWINEQSWSNGKIGTIGCSSSAEWQLALAAMDHPAHAAMVAMAPGCGVGRVGEFWEQGNWYRGGVEQMFYLHWLYHVQNTQRLRFPKGTNRNDILRLSKYDDLSVTMPKVNWKKKIWTLPLANIMDEVEGPQGVYQEMISRVPDDPAWFEGGLWHDHEDFGVPTLWLFSWYDLATSPNIATFNHVRAKASDVDVRENQFMILAPLPHCKFLTAESPYTLGEREVGSVDFDYLQQIFDWFDFWLKGEKNNFHDKNPKVRYFAMGANEWRASDTWPPHGAVRLSLYLSSQRGANSLFGDGTMTTTPPNTAGVDRFTYDPKVPVTSLGGGICCDGGLVQPGAFDQRTIEARADVLVYTGVPLRESLNVTGPIEITLYVSSDAKDTDFTAKLIDVYPDGRAYNLDDTIQRVRYRAGYDKEVFMEDDNVYELKLASMSTSNVFKKGHRVRVEISSSNFPRYARNLNTGGSNYNESEPVVAHNAVYHSKLYPSCLALSVVP